MKGIHLIGELLGPLGQHDLCKSVQILNASNMFIWLNSSFWQTSNHPMKNIFCRIFLKIAGAPFTRKHYSDKHLKMVNYVVMFEFCLTHDL